MVKSRDVNDPSMLISFVFTLRLPYLLRSNVVRQVLSPRHWWKRRQRQPHPWL